MNTMHPGIFIPLLSSQGHINITKGEEVIPYGSTQLFNAMLKAKIKGDFRTAVRFCAQKNQPIEYGLTLHLENPQQSEYRKALQVINHTFGLELDELTIPADNVTETEFGIKTKSVVAQKLSGPCNIFEFNEHGFAIVNALHTAHMEECKLLLSPTATGFAIYGTSPADMDCDLWEQRLKSALSNAGYTPIFSQTWSITTR